VAERSAATDPSPRQHHCYSEAAFTLTDCATLLVLCAMLCIWLVPALARANGDGGALAACLDKARAMTTACLAYATDHAGTLPTDGRNPDPVDLADHIADAITEVPASQTTFDISWFAHLAGYRSANPDDWDCPIIDDQRKTEFWPTDYVMNRWAINTNPDIADEPDRAVLIGEPNMYRGGFLTLLELIAWSEWGPRPDLEQHLAGSLSFGFIDGHAVRLTIPDVDSPHLLDYPELYLADPGQSHTNYLWLTTDQTLPTGE